MLGHLKHDCRVKMVCNRCGKSYHIKKNYRVNITEAEVNIAYKDSGAEQLKWEQCLSIEVIDQPLDMTSLVH